MTVPVMIADAHATNPPPTSRRSPPHHDRDGPANPHRAMDRAIPAIDANGNAKTEHVVIEEPLQITLDGHPISVVMRTPGHDEDLVRGFLITEGILSSLEAIRRIDLESKKNHALVFLSDETEIDLGKLTRHVFSASSCGICGKASIDAITNNFPPLEAPLRFPSSAILTAPDTLRAAQETFDTTGGLHAAALFDSDGRMLAVREDIGRHNAVDKLIGHALSDNIDPATTFLLVSGRISFEIMQKSLAAAIPLVAAISAPSSLAIDFAEKANQTLVAFLRPPKFNVYSGALK
ncbi:formate dehydrogenase accessory sulfurtransferase FdhD [Haloferula sp.]|uniref:formate dehydrogenase accessory sulfurtransferase FdhD n=1 Tax=Haloferula sp. TaxID=2497595 RepID=UPI0032A0C704